MTVIWGSRPGQTGFPPSRTVPNVIGETVSQTDHTLIHADLNLTASGNMQGNATSQSPTAGVEAFYGDYVIVTFA